MTYAVDAWGDVCARVVDGVEEAVDPDMWGWARPRDAAQRCSLENAGARPGFTVTVTPTPERAREPGPKPKIRISPGEWAQGEAPPAMAFSQAGFGTSEHLNRLSDAVGYAVRSLPRNPQSNPFHIWDIVGGRLIEITYTSPHLTPGGAGSVYVLDDGVGVKIGYTRGETVRRIAELQTGNPRLISPVAVILDASEAVEAHLHAQFADIKLVGEWFDRDHLLALAREAGGWEALLRDRLPEGDWRIDMQPTYA